MYVITNKCKKSDLFRVQLCVNIKSSLRENQRENGMRSTASFVHVCCSHGSEFSWKGSKKWFLYCTNKFNSKISAQNPTWPCCPRPSGPKRPGMTSRPVLSNLPHRDRAAGAPEHANYPYFSDSASPGHVHSRSPCRRPERNAISKQ